MATVTNVLNVAPLNDAISPYFFGFRYLGSAAQADLSTEAAKAVRDRQQYLLWLSKRLKITSNEPILCLALTRAALSVEVRKGLIAALTELDSLISKEIAPKKAAAVPVAEVIAAPTVPFIERVEETPTVIDVLPVAKAKPTPKPRKTPPAKAGKRV